MSRGCGVPGARGEAASDGTRAVTMAASLPGLKPLPTVSPATPLHTATLLTTPSFLSHSVSLSPNHWLPGHSLASTGPAGQDRAPGPDPLAKDLGTSPDLGLLGQLPGRCPGARPLSPSGHLGPARPLSQRPNPSAQDTSSQVTCQDLHLPPQPRDLPGRKVRSPVGQGQSTEDGGRAGAGAGTRDLRDWCPGTSYGLEVAQGRGYRLPLGGHRAEAPRGCPGPSLPISHPEGKPEGRSPGSCGIR